MLKLDDVRLEDTLPQSIARYEQVQHICQAIDKQLQNVRQQTSLILLLPRLDELSETLVDELAWEYHVDFYRPELSLEKKRSLVRQAIAWHRIKGTPAAVESVCSAVFQSASVEENWQYGGEPYHFKVKVIKEAVPDTTVIDMLVDAINSTKNTRSWLDEIGFYREAKHTFFIAVPMSKLATIYAGARKFALPDIKNKAYMSSSFTAFKKIDATYAKYHFPAEGVQFTNYTAAVRSLLRRIEGGAAIYKAPEVRKAIFSGATLNSFRRIDIYG